MTGKGKPIRPVSAPVHTARTMEPSLKPYFDHVWPVFWPWLVWNLIRFARWHLRTGQDALLAVDCFGNIRITRLCDAPQADDLYVYEVPKVASWDRLAPDCEPLLPREKGLGMRGRGIADSAMFAARPFPLTPTPLPGERGLTLTGRPRAPP